MIDTVSKPRIIPRDDARPAFRSAATRLREMAKTFEERNKVYGDNYLKVGAVMKILFPDGVQLTTEDDFNVWHLFELAIVKITRFANSKCEHVDSVHDSAVYLAMVESLIDQEQQS